MQDRGWIDLHSHILPQLDDGSDSVEMSLAMLRREAEQGVDVVCATSHYYAKYNSIPAFCERRAEAMERLAAVLTLDLPQVLPAAEVAYFPRMEEQDLTPLCIQGTRTLMLEMPFADWTSLQPRQWKRWCWTAGIRWCWCTPSGFASANPTGTNWKNWRNCPSGCRSTRVVCSAGAPGVWRWTCCRWPISAAGQRLPQPDQPPAQSQRRKKSCYAKTGRSVP